MFGKNAQAGDVFGVMFYANCSLARFAPGLAGAGFLYFVDQRAGAGASSGDSADS